MKKYLLAFLLLAFELNAQSANPYILGIVPLAAGDVVVATDDFNRGDNADLGSNWDVVTSLSALNILTNEVVAPGDPIGERWNADSFNDDQYAQLTLRTMVTDANNGIGPACRIASGANTQYFYIANTVDSRLFEIDANSYTQLDIGSAAGTGDILKLRCIGTAIEGLNDEVADVSATNSVVTAGNGGIFGADEGAINPTGDDWEAGNAAN